MSAQKGKDLLLKIDSGGDFVTVAGLRSRRIAFNSQTVDITDADSSGRWRELLAGAGVKAATLSGSGVFRDEATDERARAVFFNGEIPTFQVVIPDFGTVEGPFQITAIEYAGTYNGEATYEMSMASAGALDFVAATLPGLAPQDYLGTGGDQPGVIVGTGEPV